MKCKFAQFLFRAFGITGGALAVEVITPALGDEWLDSMDAGGEENAESV